MTLQIMDNASSGDLSRWNPGSTANRATATPRFPTAPYYYTACALTKTIPAVAEVFVLCAFRLANSGSQTLLVLSGDAGATPHLTVTFDTSQKLKVYRGTAAGTLLATGAMTITRPVWHQIQVRVVISDTVGVVQVRVDGAASNDIDFSGDTKNAGTNVSVDTVKFSTFDAQDFMTDFAVIDTSGSVLNTWPGDVRVVTCSPSGNGATSDGVNSAATSVNNFTYVDELPFSSTDYVGVATAGAGDTYAMSDLPVATTNVKAVMLVLSAAKSDTGAKSLKRRIRSGGTTYAGSAVALSTAYASILEVVELDPATGSAWTASGVNALEAGFEAV